MLFEMLTGELPFKGDAPFAALTAILTQPVPDIRQLRRDVPEALANLIYRMLEKDRDKHIPGAGLACAQLETMLAKENRD
jgi:serine/threonine-protein kinase